MIIFLICTFIETLAQSNQVGYFNFPVQKGQPNLIYLEQYTPDAYYPAIYGLNNNNQLNLSLIQSVQQIYNNQSTTGINNITCVSNYIVESGTTSNVFWMLANNLELYSGLIDQFGGVRIEKVNIKLAASNCFNINLINYNYGLLTCLISGNLSFISVNISSLSTQSYQSSYNNTFNSLFTFISINDLNNYTISVAGIHQNYSVILTYILNNNQLTFNNSASIIGSFKQVCSTDDLKYFIFLSQNYILQYTVSSNTTLTLKLSRDQIQNIALFQVSENTYQLAFITQQLVSLMFVDAKIGDVGSSSSIILQTPNNISIFSMNQQNIFIITDNYIAVQYINQYNLLEGQLFSVSNYLNINLNIQSSIINQDRNLAVIFSTNSTNQQLSTYYFTNPQIQITLSQQNQIVSGNTPLQLNISVTSQLSQVQPTYFILNLVSVDYTVSQCPIQTQVNQSNLNIQYPTYTTIPFSNIYQGPFLTPTIQSTNQNYVQVYTNNQESIVNNYQFTQQTYQVLCAYQFSIPIYCTQYQNYSVVISQWFSTQTIVTNPQTNQNLTSCDCFVKETGKITVVMQFQQQVIIQQLLPYFYLGNQNVVNFDQQIISSGILMDSLFVITQDNSLFCYEIVKNTSSLSFNYIGQQFKKIYINEESYPNYLFIDNTTNLIILSYNGQSSFEIINSIAYPITDYTSSSFGILQNGIYLTLLTTTNSQLYYYPKDYIFIQNNQQLYYQVSLFGYNLYGPNIVSSFTETHFYLVTLTSANVCCQILIFEGTGSAFTSPTSIQPMQVSTFTTFNAVTKSLEDIDLVYYYQANPNSQKSFNFSVPIQASYILIPYYVNPDLFSLSTIVNFTNTNCSQSISQNVIITYDQQQISSLPYITNYLCYTSIYFNVNPAILFSGNIETLTATCQNCTAMSVVYPIVQTFYYFNISYQAAIYYKGNLYLQDNLSVYWVNSTELQYIASIPGQNQTCNSLFIELLSGFLVSVCYQGNNAYLYAYNQTLTQNITIQYNLTLPAQFSQANYSQGILQIVSQNSNNVSNYVAYYLWIANNSINLSFITELLNLFANKEFQFIALFESFNFSSDPCQILGLTSQQQLSSFEIPVFYILKTCMSSNLSQIFGYPGNNYTANTLEYFTTQVWNIFSTLAPFQNQVGCIIQYGRTKLLTPAIIKASFIVPYQQVAYKYYVLFNQSNGNITSFWQANSFYITSSGSNNQYEMYQNLDNPLVNIEGLNNASSVNICVYPSKYNNKNEDQITYNIGCIQLNNFNSSLNRGSYGNTFLIVDSETQNTIAFQIMDTLQVKVNLNGYQTSTLTLAASNQLGTSKQIFTITNLDYQIYIPPSDDNKPTPTDSDTDSKQSHLGLILGLTFGILFLIAIILAAIYYFKKKQQQQQQNEPLYEMR